MDDAIASVRWMLHIEKSEICIDRLNQQSMANRNKQQLKHNHKQDKQKYTTKNGWKRLVPELVFAARSRTAERRESLLLVLFSRRQCKDNES